MLAAMSVLAEDGDPLEAGLDWDYCGLRPARLGPATLPSPPGNEEPVSIEADDLGYDRNSQLLKLEGNIDLQQGSRQIRAQAMSYGVATEEVTAEGDLFLAQPGVRILGKQGTLNLKTNQGQITQPRYRFAGPLNARGDAQSAQLLEQGKTHYEDIVFTSCPPGRRDWDLAASRLDIDQAEGRGGALRDQRIAAGAQMVAVLDVDDLARVVLVEVAAVDPADAEGEPTRRHQLLVAGEVAVAAQEVQLDPEVDVELRLQLEDVVADVGVQGGLIAAVQVVGQGDGGQAQPLALGDDGRDLHGRVGAAQVPGVDVQVDSRTGHGALG